MDIKEIATKVVAGGNVEELTKGLDDTQKGQFYIVLREIAKTEADKELENLKGRRAATAAVKADEEKLEGEAVIKVRTQIRGEQLTKARSRFMADNNLTEEQMKPVDDAFKTEDTGKFDADLIIPDLRRAYAKAHAETLLGFEKQNKEQQRQAAEANAAGATGGATGSGGSGEKTYSPQVHEWVREASKRGIQMTFDEAERGLKGGTRRF